MVVLRDAKELPALTILKLSNRRVKAHGKFITSFNQFVSAILLFLNIHQSRLLILTTNSYCANVVRADRKSCIIQIDWITMLI